jgi:hypothetical protein
MDSLFSLSYHLPINILEAVVIVDNHEQIIAEYASLAARLPRRSRMDRAEKWQRPAGRCGDDTATRRAPDQHVHKASRAGAVCSPNMHRTIIPPLCMITPIMSVYVNISFE